MYSVLAVAHHTSTETCRKLRTTSVAHDAVMSPRTIQGEDLSAADRKQEQMSQCKSWWEEQAAHKAALKAAQADADKAFAELVRYQDMLQLHNKQEEATIRRELAATTTEINMRLVRGIH